MKMPRIYRIRYIPSETVDLSADTLLYRDQQYLITQWAPIKPRSDIAGGISCVFLEKGWKISAVWGDDKKIKYWYCDIIELSYDAVSDTYHLYDLLTDIVIFDDGRVRVIDLDELAAAYEQGLITKQQLLTSLRCSHSLLERAYQVDLPGQVLNIFRHYAGWECKL